MRTRHKRWALLAMVVCLVAVLTLWSTRREQPNLASAIAVRFIGYTNAPNTNLRFALLSISNQAGYVVALRNEWVEVQGSAEQHARVLNTDLPWKLERIINGRRAVMLAVGEPSMDSEATPWRFAVSFSQYTF